ncbi:hypothetical protein ABW365_05415 [Enterococcus avium]
MSVRVTGEWNVGQSAGGLSAADYSRRLFCGAAKRRDHRAPIQKRSFIDQAEKAIYSLCYLRREYSITLNYKGGPLDYFQLPVTPFLYHYGNVPFSSIGSRIEVFFIRGI